MATEHAAQETAEDAAEDTAGTEQPKKKPQRSSRSRDDRERTTRKRAASTDGRRTRQSSRDNQATHGSDERRAAHRVKGTDAAAMAAQQLLELTGREAEGVTGLHRRDDGWDVQVEVVEVRRIPDTTDVLALYEVQVDDEGQLEGYRRLRRYGRGKAREE